MTKKMLWRTFLIALLAALIVLGAGIGVIAFQASNTQKRELEVDANLIAQLWDGDVASLETLRPHADLRITVVNISDGEVIYDNTAEVDEEHASEVDGVLSDCVAACRDLGLSLDDIERCMARKIKRMKQDEGLGSGGASGDGRGRIVRVDMGSEVRDARTGA